MPNRRGFTLIELLIVILIIGITSGVALLAFGDFGAERQLKLAAEQLSSYIQLLEEKAIIETSTFGITINGEGYETYRFHQGAWRPLAKRFFRWRSFPRDTKIVLRKITQGTKGPDIVIQPSGNITAFDLSIGNKTKPNIIRLMGSSNGEIQLKTPAS